jgi:hypothetical protein
MTDNTRMTAVRIRINCVSNPNLKKAQELTAATTETRHEPSSQQEELILRIKQIGWIWIKFHYQIYQNLI